MKLTIATLAASLTLAGAASAMVPGAGHVQPRDAALGAIETTTTGERSTIDADTLTPSDQEERVAERVNIYTFDAPVQSPRSAADLR